MTPEATLAVLDREIRAIPVAMWVESLKITPRTMQSRVAEGVTRGRSLILSLPGSYGAGEPVHRHRRAGAHHTHGRRRGPRIIRQKPDACASGFLDCPLSGGAACYALDFSNGPFTGSMTMCFRHTS